jgi:hypothetical protein
MLNNLAPSFVCKIKKAKRRWLKNLLMNATFNYFFISLARPISHLVIASTSNDFKESLTVFQLIVIIG